MKSRQISNVYDSKLYEEINIMSNTFTQLHIQLVFAVQYRAALIQPSWKERLQQYISATIQNEKHKILQVNSMPDHIHLLVGLHPAQSLSSLVQKAKSTSSAWVNNNEFTVGRFAWQEGFGAFSYGRSSLSNVIRYIQNQQAHHKLISFLDEYRALLKAFEIDFEERNIFTVPV